MKLKSCSRYSPWKHGLLILLVALLAIASARLYAAWLTPILDADNAIHALMAYHFQFPSDLYYWGQNRRGSLEPLIAHFIIRAAQQHGISLSPLLLLSVIQYSLIGIAYFSLSSFLQHHLSKGIFALVWFFPPAGLSSLLMPAHPYYAQLALMGLGFWGISHLENQGKSQNTRFLWQTVAHQCFISFIVLCLGLSLWISELSVLPLLVLVLRFLLLYLHSPQLTIQERSIPNRYYSNLFHWKKSTKTYFLNISLVLFSCFGSILYAKSNTRNVSAYSSFATVGEAFQNLLKILERLKLIGLFQANHFLLSIAFDGFILCTVFTFVWFTWQRNKSAIDFLNPSLKDWGNFFMVSTLTSTTFLLLSKWVYLNDTHPRYFTFPFILGILSLLIGVEKMSEPYRKLSGLILGLFASCSALSFPVYLRDNVGFEPVRNRLNDFLDYSNSAFIGDYWTAYLVCSISPAELSCTPHEQSYIRCDHCIEDVMSTEGKKIYLIKERWLREFPEKLSQFNKTLVKSGEPELVGGYTIVPYQILETTAEL